MPDAEKKFNLKQTETNLLATIRNNNQSTFAATLSSIAIDRLGYHVTQNTQFILSDDLTEITIKELPEDVPTIPAEPPEAETLPPEPKSGAVAAK